MRSKEKLLNACKSQYCDVNIIQLEVLLDIRKMLAQLLYLQLNSATPISIIEIANE